MQSWEGWVISVGKQGDASQEAACSWAFFQFFFLFLFLFFFFSKAQIGWQVWTLPILKPYKKTKTLKGRCPFRSQHLLQPPSSMCFWSADPQGFWLLTSCVHTGLPKSYQEAQTLSVSLDTPLWHELLVVLCSGHSFSWVATSNHLVQVIAFECQYCTTIGLPNLRGWVGLFAGSQPKPHDSEELSLGYKQADFIVSIGFPKT